MNKSSSLQGQFTMDALEYRKIDAEIANLIATSSKLNAETAKLNAETAKIAKQTYWYPLGIAIGLVSAIAALVKLFF